MTRHSALKLLIFYCISFLISQLPLYPVTLSLQSRMSLQIFTFLLGPIYLILISHLLIAILPVPLRTALNFLDLIGPRKHRGLVTGGCLLGLEIMDFIGLYYRPGALARHYQPSFYFNDYRYLSWSLFFQH